MSDSLRSKLDLLYKSILLKKLQNLASNQVHSASDSLVKAYHQPDEKIRQIADQYAASRGIKLNHSMHPLRVDKDHAAKIAQSYDQMKHAPVDPAVKSAYDALIRETADQFHHIRNGDLKVSSMKPGMENPYKTSQDLFNDINQNNHMWFYPTEAGFGSGGSNFADHPMLADTGVKTDDGHPLLANDMFRIVHDYFGHAKEGFGFGPNGEENAWRHHKQMFSPEAQKALTSETRGQNSWVNFGPHGEHNRSNPTQTVYADQKAGLMPDWTLGHGADHALTESDLGKSEESSSEEDQVKVAVVLLYDKNFILMGRRRKNDKWALPGGRFDDDETKEEVAIRELEEEAGIKLKADDLKYAGTRTIRNKKVYMFLAQYPGGETTLENDPDEEFVEWQWIRCEDGKAPDWLLEGEINPPTKAAFKKLGMIKSNPVLEGLLKTEGGLDETAAPLMNRQEDKFLLPASSLADLTRSLKAKLKEGDVDTSARYNVNRTTYLDNRDMDSFRDVMEGVKPRFKIRIRQYKPNNEEWEDVAYIEMKAKTSDGYTKKFRVRVPASEVDKIASGGDIVVDATVIGLNRDITKDVLWKRAATINSAITQCGFKKQVVVEYNRRAFSSDDIRITIDDSLKYHGALEIEGEVLDAITESDKWDKIVKPVKKLMYNDYVILEVKHQTATPAWALDLIRDAGGKAVKFSKYFASISCNIIHGQDGAGIVSRQKKYDVAAIVNEAVGEPFGKSEELRKAPVQYDYDEDRDDKKNHDYSVFSDSNEYRLVGKMPLPNGLEYHQYQHKRALPEYNRFVHTLYHPDYDTHIAMLETASEPNHDEGVESKPNTVNWSEVHPLWRGKGLGRQAYMAALIHGQDMHEGMHSDMRVSPAAHKSWLSFRGIPGIGGRIAPYGGHPDNQFEHHHVFVRDPLQLPMSTIFHGVKDNYQPAQEKLAASEADRLEIFQKTHDLSEEHLRKDHSHHYLMWPVSINGEDKDPVTGHRYHVTLRHVGEQAPNPDFLNHYFGNKGDFVPHDFQLQPHIFHTPSGVYHVLKMTKHPQWMQDMHRDLDEHFGPDKHFSYIPHVSVPKHIYDRFIADPSSVKLDMKPLEMWRDNETLWRAPQKLTASEVDLNKASKNVREQRAKVFGTSSAPKAGSPMQEKHMDHIKNFAEKFLDLKIQPSGGKINPETGKRRDKDAEEGVDKPDWRSGNLESQWNPDAMVHEIAHLMLLPKGVGIQEGQKLMDKQYGEVQSKYGYMKQKRSQGEVQPMAAEQLIRRFIGLPANRNAVPAAGKDAPPRTSVEDPSVVIGTRVKHGKTKAGEDKWVDLIRQSRFLTPENRQRMEDIFSKKVIFHPERGWVLNEQLRDSAKKDRADAEARQVKQFGRKIRFKKEKLAAAEDEMINLVKKIKLDVEEAKKVVQEKNDEQVDTESSYSWASKAIACYQLYKSTGKLKWFMRGDDYRHEALEHAALAKDEGKTVHTIQSLIDEDREEPKDE